MAVADVQIQTDGAVASVEGATEQGEEFVDSWLLGVLSVQDAGRITVTSEVVGDLARGAGERGLTVEAA